MNSHMKKPTNNTSTATIAGCGSVVSKRTIFGLLVSLKRRRGIAAGTRIASDSVAMVVKTDRSKAKQIQ